VGELSLLLGMRAGEKDRDIHAPCRALVAALKNEITTLQAEMRGIRQEVQSLRAQINQNSRNSSKPPSSDPPSGASPSPEPSTGRKPGGQPGHEGQTHKLVPTEKVDEVISVKPQRCRDCGHALSGNDPDPLRHQVTEIPPITPKITEYQRHRLTCPKCRSVILADLPLGVPAGIAGPRLQAIVAYLTGKGHLSKRDIEEVLEDLLGVSLSLGSIIAIEKNVSEALASPVEEARQYVQEQPVVHSDETGWRENRKRAWLWAAVTPLVTVFLVHVSRGAVAARALLGDFLGYLITDRWNAYNGWAVRKRQLCWAHLIRDFRGFTERGKKAARIGEALLLQTEKMFALWHRVRDGTLKRSSFRVSMNPLRREVEDLLEGGTRCGESKTEGMCKRILKLAPALWTFARIEGVEPTNNAAERAVRPAVLYRKGCFGTHSAEGSRFVERILTVVMTLHQQERNVFDYLTRACTAALYRRKAPSLLPRLRPHAQIAA